MVKATATEQNDKLKRAVIVSVVLHIIIIALLIWGSLDEDTSMSGGGGGIPSFNEARAEFEKEYLIRLLRTTEGNVTLAANMAGRNRTDFYKLLNRHGIEAANFKSKG